MRRLVPWLVGFGCAALAACAGTPDCAPPYASATLLEMHAGRSRENAPEVSDADLTRFFQEEAVPRFPEGFTIKDARGQWRDAKTGQSISERSVVFSVIVPGHASEARSKLDAMGLAYVRRFSQQAVMRTAAPV